MLSPAKWGSTLRPFSTVYSTSVTSGDGHPTVYRLKAKNIQLNTLVSHLDRHTAQHNTYEGSLTYGSVTHVKETQVLHKATCEPLSTSTSRMSPVQHPGF